MASSERSNYVGEWFGHRIYPAVSCSPLSLRDQRERRCPFLSDITRQDCECTKAVASKGVCTISSPSNGKRQDWLVCPNRALVAEILETVGRRLFGGGAGDRPMVIPAPRLQSEETQRQVIRRLKGGGKVIVAFQEKLGGEISIPATDRSPEISFDVTLAELQYAKGRLDIGQFGILEVQTMDFHGSYSHAVKNLTDALRLHSDTFYKAVRDNPRWLGERIEGPNKANVFKRTFYQLAFKFRLGLDRRCAGCVIAITSSVWDSWQPHLGKPDLVPLGKTESLLSRTGRTPAKPARAWIYVFEPEAESPDSPNPLRIRNMIATDADSLVHYALKVAPEAAVGIQGRVDLIPLKIRERLVKLWRAFGQADAAC